MCSVPGKTARCRLYCITDDHIHTCRDILYVQTLHYVHTVCMASKRWAAAATYGEIALPAFKRYYGHKTGVVAALLVRYVMQTVGYRIGCDITDTRLGWWQLF